MRAWNWRRLGALLAFLGPGLIAGAAGDDVGGIATYASVGAQYGYDLLWVIIPITVSLIVVQLQVARMGVVTGKGFAELIREEFGVKWTAKIVTATYRAVDLREGFKVDFASDDGTEWTLDVSKTSADRNLFLGIDPTTGETSPCASRGVCVP